MRLVHSTIMALITWSRASLKICILIGGLVFLLKPIPLLLKLMLCGIMFSLLILPEPVLMDFK